MSERRWVPRLNFNAETQELCLCLFEALRVLALVSLDHDDAVACGFVVDVLRKVEHFDGDDGHGATEKAFSRFNYLGGSVM